MNRFEEHTKSMKPGETKSVHAENLGMDAQTFHDFADSLKGGIKRDFVVIKDHRESQTSHRHIDLIVIQRTE